ncbi:hypothetical protein ACLIA0_07725 [Bacillaceae bacterium W0354]
MFDQYKELFIQPYTSWKNVKSRYSIMVNKETVGTIIEMKTKKWNLSYLFNTYFNLSHFNGFDLEVKDEENEIIGYLRKEGGFFKNHDIYLFSKNKELIATIKSKSTLTKTDLIVIYQDVERYECKINTMSIDIPITDYQTGETITLIRKRSPIYETIQENVEKGIDGYYVKTADHKNETMIRVALCVALDFYYR